MVKLDKKTLKLFLPATLFGRALLILMLPLVLVQLVAIYMFYERHWDSIVRNMSNALAGEVVLLVREFETVPKAQRVKRVTSQGELMGFGVFFDESKKDILVKGRGSREYPEFYALLSQQLAEPFIIRSDGPDHGILVSIQMEEGTLDLRTTRKRLVSPTTYIFVLWMAGSAFILMIIAVLFLRNQIRPIRSLAQAAERFGMGKDTPDFSPRGALEVRQAGKAFVTMRNRIQRQVSTRTEMLAGISHDLRTPLTRIRLQLAMLELEPQARRELEAEVEEMEHMIKEYIDFARGEGREQSEAVSIRKYMEGIIENYIRHGQAVSQDVLEDLVIEIRPKSIRRAMQNIIDNALRYGKRAIVSVQRSGPVVYLCVDDEGPGIPEESHEAVFRPFTRLDPSRNEKTGGVGLGLSIARDIVQAHGGIIRLLNLPEGGLRVVIGLPVQKDSEGV